MCDLPSTGREHVPPQCFFPKAKDLGSGTDLRKNLDTVPSCDLHNLKKSKDDQYFLNVVAGLELINEVGRNHYQNQIRRQNKRNPSIITRFRDRANEEAGRLVHEIEIQRLDRFFEQFARAMFYLHYSKKWLGDVGWFPEFLARPTATMEEAQRQNLIRENDCSFEKRPFFGENPSVFRYQVLELNEGVRMRVSFYGGCKALLVYDATGD